jgi:cell division protein FtsZ
LQAAEAAITNPLLGEVTMRGARGLLVSITGSYDMTLYEVEEAASRIRREVDPDENPDVNIIVGATFDSTLQRRIRVSVVATGIQPGAEYVPATHRVSTAGSPAGLDDRLTAAGMGRNGSREQVPPGGGRQGDRNDRRHVQLAPKGRMDSGQNFGSGAEPSSGFEPVAPGKSVRAPKRPLILQDFPEFHQGGDGQSQPSRSPAKPRGFFDWMAGRNKGSGKAASQNPGQKTVTLQPRLPHEKHEIEPELNGHRNGYGARSSQLSDSRASAGDDLAAPYRSGEVTDIPEFFKKPVS